MLSCDLFLSHDLSQDLCQQSDNNSPSNLRFYLLSVANAVRTGYSSPSPAIPQNLAKILGHGVTLY